MLECESERHVFHRFWQKWDKVRPRKQMDDLMKEQIKKQECLYTIGTDIVRTSLDVETSSPEKFVCNCYVVFHLHLIHVLTACSCASCFCHTIQSYSEKVKGGEFSFEGPRKQLARGSCNLL